MKVIILCGGMGTRLREETEYKPKPMVEIGGKPILWHIMKHYSHYGFKEFVLALGYKGDVIRNYFLNFYKYNSDFAVDLANHGNVEIYSDCINEDWKVTLVETGDESMTGYRTKICGKYITEDRFMLTYGDAVSNVDIAKLVKFNEKINTIGTVTGVYPPSRFGDLVIDGNKVGMDSFKRQQKICFYSKNEKDTNGRPKRFMLDIPNVFSLQGYFDYIFNILRFDISTHVETQYHHSKEYQILENIYSQLKTKSK
jgi:glucose-1-phosphate cytidylyltransferase